MNNKGFTLIELMIVIAIIAIMAAIAIPQFQIYREKTHNMAIQSDLKNFITVMELYRAGNSSYPADFAELKAYTDFVPLSDGVTITFIGGVETWSATGTSVKKSKIYTVTGPGGTIVEN